MNKFKNKKILLAICTVILIAAAFSTYFYQSRLNNKKDSKDKQDSVSYTPDRDIDLCGYEGCSYDWFSKPVEINANSPIVFDSEFNAYYINDKEQEGIQKIYKYSIKDKSLTKLTTYSSTRSASQSKLKYIEATKSLYILDIEGTLKKINSDGGVKKIIEDTQLQITDFVVQNNDTIYVLSNQDYSGKLIEFKEGDFANHKVIKDLKINLYGYQIISLLENNNSVYLIYSELGENFAFTKINPNKSVVEKTFSNSNYKNYRLTEGPKYNLFSADAENIFILLNHNDFFVLDNSSFALKSNFTLPDYIISESGGNSNTISQMYPYNKKMYFVNSKNFELNYVYESDFYNQGHKLIADVTGIGSGIRDFAIIDNKLAISTYKDNNRLITLSDKALMGFESAKDLLKFFYTNLDDPYLSERNYTNAYYISSQKLDLQTFINLYPESDSIKFLEDTLKETSEGVYEYLVEINDGQKVTTYKVESEFIKNGDNFIQIKNPKSTEIAVSYPN